MSFAADSGVALLLATVVLTVGLLLFRRAARYPPGPPAWPFFGNMHLLPAESRWKHIFQATKTYRNLIFYHDYRSSILFVNNHEVARELLDSRGSIYSDRPNWEMLKIMQLQMLGFDRFDSQWQLRRKIFHQHFNKITVRKYIDTISRETLMYALRVLRNPTEFEAETRLLSIKSILEITYGLQIDSPDDEYVKSIEDMSQRITMGALPNTWAVDTFPLLRHLPSWLPGTRSVRVARAWAPDVIVGQSKPWNFAVEQTKETHPRPSFVSEALESAAASESLLKSVSSGIYIGGSDSTILTMHAFYLAMTLFPNVQRTAQEELDRVVGTKRLPEIQDREHLPYLEAVLKETLRWFVVAPLALPHRLMRDDIYQGYVIPKGTLVIANSWAFSQDPTMYPNPEEFRPERFLEALPDGSLPMDPIKYAFGYGRRVCPGLEFANLSLWHTMASILSTMTIAKAKDAEGNVVEPVVQEVAGVLRYLKPFECRIEPRSATTLSLLDEAVMLRA